MPEGQSDLQITPYRQTGVPFDKSGGGDGIGVQIIEGDHPGSSYYAAVLRQDVDYVNQVARGLGLTFRFRQG